MNYDLFTFGPSVLVFHFINIGSGDKAATLQQNKGLNQEFPFSRFCPKQPRVSRSRYFEDLRPLLIHNYSFIGIIIVCFNRG